jgi:hypothetical protein
MLELIVFLDQQLGDKGFPASWDDNAWDGTGVRWRWGVLLFFLLFSAVGAYVFSHLLRIH